MQFLLCSLLYYVCVTNSYNSSLLKAVINSAGLTILNIGKNAKTDIVVSHCIFMTTLVL